MKNAKAIVMSLISVLAFSLTSCTDEGEAYTYSDLTGKSFSDITLVQYSLSPFAGAYSTLPSADQQSLFDYINVDYRIKEYEVLSYNYVEYFYILQYKTASQYESVASWVHMLRNGHLYVEHHKSVRLPQETKSTTTIECYLSVNPMSNPFCSESRTLYWCR